MNKLDFILASSLLLVSCSSQNENKPHFESVSDNVEKISCRITAYSNYNERKRIDLTMNFNTTSDYNQNNVIDLIRNSTAYSKSIPLNREIDIKVDCQSRGSSEYVVIFK